MIDDIDLNKAAIIRRCLKRIAEEYREDPSRLDDFTIQDSVILNLLRASAVNLFIQDSSASLGSSILSL